MIPKVLLTYFVRPMSVGVMFRFAARQAGCEVMVAGPGENQVYGIENWADDYIPPDIELPIEPVDINETLAAARARGFNPDLICSIDQYDFYYPVGNAPPDVPWVVIAVEDFNPQQRERYEQRSGAIERHMIAHAFPQLVPPDSEWMAFGFDFFLHACGPVGERDKLVCQVGSPYEPRPDNWNYLRFMLDNAPAMHDEFYRHGLAESARTVFGRTPTYAQMRDAYQRSWFALSSSNCEFLPMRVPEALGFGNILVSDNVAPVRAVMGDPWPENAEGCWVAHDRTSGGMLRAIQSVLAVDGLKEAMQQRAIVRGYSGHSYYHRMKQILARVGISSPARMV